MSDPTAREDATSNRTRGRQLLIGVGVALVLVAGSIIGWQWYAERGTGTEVDTGEHVLPGGEPAFARTTTFEARGSALRVNGETLPVAGGRIDRAVWSAHGFFVSVGDRHGSSWAYVDRAGTHRLPGRPGAPVVSPGGSHAAWVDFDGPQWPMGRLARLLVVDLASGEVVLRTGEGMGDRGDDLDDLYGELSPRAIGFEGEGAGLTVVWSNAEGSGEEVRTVVETGRSTS